jgi:hypothetical protein
MRTPVSIPTALIYPNADGRPVVKQHVAMLAESIRAIGLQSPITVRPAVRVRDGVDAEVYEIVAGRHRYEAVLSLNIKEIDAFLMEGDADDAELWEIDENFARADLTDAQRAVQHVRRREILIKKGLLQPIGRPKSSQNAKVSYPEEAAQTLGVHRATVYRDLARGKKIDPAVLSTITGTDLDMGVVLDELAAIPRDQQLARIDEIRARRESEKVNRDLNRAIALTDAEQFAEWIMARTDLNELDTIISWLEGTKPKDVIAALRREAA